MYKNASAQTAELKKLQTYPKVVGVKQIRKALNAGRARWVLLARNADPAMTEPLAQQCLDSGVPFTWISDMRTLGRACGIAVGAAAAAAVAADSVLPGKPEE